MKHFTIIEISINQGSPDEYKVRETCKGEKHINGMILTRPYNSGK